MVARMRCGKRPALLGLALAFALSFVPTTALADDGASAAVAHKTEVVYASLTSSGEPTGAYVVNRFDVETPGLLIDFGDYAYGKNLTSGEDISFENGTTMVSVEKGIFSYQGNTGPVALPWDISLAYELDGQTISPDELAGATGQLAIRCKTSRDASVDSAFYKSFMLQITFTLPEEHCKSIVADGGTMAQSGADRTVAFTVLPNHDGDCLITMDVTDFEMPGVQLVGLPYTSPISMPDTDDMTSGLEDLSQGVGKLADGAEGIASGARELSSGTTSVAEGMTAVGDGLDQLSASGEQLNAGSASMASAIAMQAQALSQMAGALQATAAASGSAQLQEMAASLTQMAGGMSQMDDQYGQFQEGLAQYTAGTTAMAANFGQLEEGTASLASGASSLAAGADEFVSGARTMRSETADLPSRMQREIDRMTADFDFPEFVPTSFMSSKNANVESVQFVLTTSAIEKPADEETTEEETDDATIIDRFLALFGW